MAHDYLRHPVHALAENIRVMRRSKLWFQVIVALILGVLLGVMLGSDVNLVSPETADVVTNWLALPGNLFLRLIKMIIIPLVFSSIIMGIIASGDPDFVKRLGPKLVLYFLFTTIVATLIGFGVASFIEPGKYLDTSGIEIEPIPQNFGNSSISMNNLPDKIVNVLPNNPVASIVEGDLLGVVIFTILLGVALLFVRRKYKNPTAKVLRAIQDATMKIVSWAMLIAPLAVFGLMARVSSQVGFEAFLGLGMYIVTVLAGLLGMLIVYLLIVSLVAFRSPFKFIKAIFPVQLLAFSTSSSAAVMPLSMKTAEEHLKIRPSISRFLIPIGSTINMDGTALYQVVATVFLAQAFDISLSLPIVLSLIAITVGASIGAPAAPGIGIVILATILESVGVPGAGLALILGVDRILDMSRTSVNVTGDLTACTVFDKHLSKDFK
jgi:proton glutamate symport protein